MAISRKRNMAWTDRWLHELTEQQLEQYASWARKAQWLTGYAATRQRRVLEEVERRKQKASAGAGQ